MSGHVQKRVRNGKITYRARYTDPDGRERSKTFKRKADAENFLITTGADMLRGTYLDPDAGKLTLRRYAEQWMATRSWDASTRQTVEQRVRLHIIPGLGTYRLDRLARYPTIISGWHRGLTIAPAYANHVLSTLSSVLSAAVDDGLISRNPCRTSSVKRRRETTRKLVPWTAEQAAAVRAAMPERYRAMVDCGTGLGLRQGEIFGLPLDAVGFLQRNVRVRVQVRIVGNRPVFAPPKGKRERDVPMPGPVSLALAAHLARFPARPVTLPWLEPGGKPHTETLIFTTVRGHVVHRTTFNSDVWRPAREAAGLPNARENGMHALRHYYASVLLAGGVDIGPLSEYLGHQHPGFTLRVYRHLMPSDADRARKAIETALAADGPAPAREGGQRS